MSRPKTMRGLVFDAPRKIRLVDDAPVPELKPGQVLVRCTHISLCGSNTGPFLADGYWIEAERPSKVGWTGHESIGVVAESTLPEWEEGTLVLAYPCGYDGFAEYIVCGPGGLARLPDGQDPTPFVAAQPIATVMRALSRTRPVLNESCAVVGQGSIGLVFTNLLRHFGARRIIGIDKVAWRLEWSKRMGATDTIDANGLSPEEVRAQVHELTGGAMVDFSIEGAGSEDALNTAALVCRSRGRLCVFGVPHLNYQAFPWAYTTGHELEITITRSPVEAAKYFDLAIDMIANGLIEAAEIVQPVLSWERAQEAFEMFCFPAEHEDAVKVTLTL